MLQVWERWVSAHPANRMRCSSNIAISDHFPSKTFSFKHHQDIGWPVGTASRRRSLYLWYTNILLLRKTSIVRSLHTCTCFKNIFEFPITFPAREILLTWWSNSNDPIRIREFAVTTTYFSVCTVLVFPSWTAVLHGTKCGEVALHISRIECTLFRTDCVFNFKKKCWPSAITIISGGDIWRLVYHPKPLPFFCLLYLNWRHHCSSGRWRNNQRILQSHPSWVYQTGNCFHIRIPQICHSNRSSATNSGPIPAEKETLGKTQEAPSLCCQLNYFKMDADIAPHHVPLDGELTPHAVDSI